jgi:hypothetical protein
LKILLDRNQLNVANPLIVRPVILNARLYFLEMYRRASVARGWKTSVLLHVLMYQTAAEFDKLRPLSAFMFRNFEKLAAPSVEMRY